MAKISVRQLTLSSQQGLTDWRDLKEVGGNALSAELGSALRRA